MSARVRDIQTWLKILGHCNYKDVSKLENVTEHESRVRLIQLNCEGCTEGKLAQSGT